MTADLSAAERIAAEAIHARTVASYGWVPTRLYKSDIAIAVVAALAAAGWLVTPVERLLVLEDDGRNRNLSGYEPCVFDADGQCSRFGHRHDVEPVTPTRPAPAPPASSP